MSSDAPASVRLAFVGDVALAGQFLTAAQPAGAPLTYPFEQLGPLLQGTDILVLNLEGPLSHEGTPRQSVTTHLHNETSLLDWCRQFPACFCNLANNHMLDYGPEALSRTQRALAAKGMRYG